MGNYKDSKLVQLHTLKEGNCFMFNGLPYKIDRTFWYNLGRGLKRKIYVCKMKFAKSVEEDWHTVGDVEVYKISCNLFDMLVPSNVENDK